MAMIDLTKAFDSQLGRSMGDHGQVLVSTQVPQHSPYMTATVRDQQERSDPFTMRNGVKQGSSAWYFLPWC